MLERKEAATNTDDGATAPKHELQLDDIDWDEDMFDIGSEGDAKLEKSNEKTLQPQTDARQQMEPQEIQGRHNKRVHMDKVHEGEGSSKELRRSGRRLRSNLKA